METTDGGSLSNDEEAILLAQVTQAVLAILNGHEDTIDDVDSIERSHYLLVLHNHKEEVDQKLEEIWTNHLGKVREDLLMLQEDFVEALVKQWTKYKVILDKTSDAFTTLEEEIGSAENETVHLGKQIFLAQILKNPTIRQSVQNTIVQLIIRNSSPVEHSPHCQPNKEGEHVEGLAEFHKLLVDDGAEGAMYSSQVETQLLQTAKKFCQYRRNLLDNCDMDEYAVKVRDTIQRSTDLAKQFMDKKCQDQLTEILDSELLQ